MGEQILQGLDFEAMRHAMVVSQLRTTAVNDPRVVAAMGAVPRERFLPADRAALAYADRVVPLGGGRELNLPMSTGRLLTEAQPEAGMKALLIGAATGYAAMLLSNLVGSVTALEEDAALLAAARVNLADVANITLVEGPLSQGWAAGGPYDLIVIDGAIEGVPAAISGQLVDGGVLATGLVERGVTRLAVGRRAGTGFGVTAFADADAAVLPGFAPRAEFTF